MHHTTLGMKKAGVLRTLATGVLLMGLSVGVFGQCATISPWYTSGAVITPPANPGCNGSATISFCMNGAVSWARVFNTVTDQQVWYSDLNSCGAGGNGCGGTCTWESFGLPPGSYEVRLYLSGADVGSPCTTFPFSIPSHEPGDDMELQVVEPLVLPTGPCATSSTLEVSYSVPTPNCLPLPTARLYLAEGATGEPIMGTLTGNVFRFTGVPAASNYFVQASAGPLGASLPITPDEDPCPSLGGEPDTQDATSQTPGRISGTVPEIGCNIVVVVVSVATGQPVTVVEQGTSWYAEVPAGQYVVGIGAGAELSCEEEYVVEVGAALPTCAVTKQALDPVAQTEFNVANGSINFMLTFFPEYSGGTLQVRNAQGALIAELIDPPSVNSVGQLFAGTYSLRFSSTTPACASDLGSLTVPCAARRFLFADTDGDGFGDMIDRISSCVAVPGYTQDSLDCDVAVHNATGGALYCYDGDDDNVYGVRRVYCGTAPDGYVPAATMPNGPDCDDGDATITNVVGSSCMDDDPCTVNDTWGSDCTCSGDESPDTDGDGLCDAQDNCEGEGTTGSSCDDGDGATINDQLTGTGDCTCVGTPCDQAMQLSIAIRTDSHGEDIAWTVRHNASGETVCSGDTLDNNTTVTEACCMQAGGCYKLTVTDAGGNGIYRGGYVVRMGGANGPRLIDNTDNFRTGSVSTMSGLESFCYAMGPVALASRSCDKMNWVKGQQLACDEHPSVTAAYINGAPLSAQSTTVGYDFWIFDPNGSFSQHYFRSHAMANQRVWAGPGRAAHLPINKWDAAVAPHIPGNKLLNVRVRPVYPGSTDPYGPACRFMLDPSREECPISALVDNPSSFQHSCNVQRSRRNGLNFPTWVYADAIHHPFGEIGFQDRYQFRFRNVADGYDTTLTSNSSHISLAWRERPLQVGHTYDVDVRVSTDGGATWCASSEPGGSWGAVCSVTIVENGSGLAPEDGTLTDDAVDVLLYPDPVTEGQLFLHTTGLPLEVERVDVDIHSITGERVRSQQLPATAGMVHTRLELPADMASGVYLVVLKAEGQRWTRRVVIQ